MLGFYWSLSTLFFYLFLAFLGMWCMNFIKKDSQTFSFKNCLTNKYVLLWLFIWTFFAAFRHVSFYIGGADAKSYIGFFEKCNNVYYDAWMLHAGHDVLFKWINKIIRFITDDYHAYFLIVYGFMTFASIAFAQRFSRKEFNIAPYLLVFYLYLRSYNTLRTNLAIAFILIGLIYFADKKITKAYLWTFASVLIHKASLLYALALIFIHVFQKRRLTLKVASIMILCSVIAASLFQDWFTMFAGDVDLGGSYASYAVMTESEGFLTNFWKIAFEQIILGLFMALNSTKIKNYINSLAERNTLNVLWHLCIFDMITIPVTFYLNIWRGYEYLYIPRIVMWGLILYLYTYKRPKYVRIIYTGLYIILFTAWMSFRIERTYEDSALMPYIFDYSLFYV